MVGRSIADFSGKRDGTGAMALIFFFGWAMLAAGTDSVPVAAPPSSSLPLAGVSAGADPSELGKVPNVKRLAEGIPPFRPSAPIAGKEPSPFPAAITLTKALEIAVIRNLDLLTQKSNIEQSRAQLLIAKEFPNPNASLSTAKIGKNSDVGMGNGFFQRSYDSIGSVSQLIELGGKRKWRQLAAKHGLLNAEALFQDAERQLKAAVTKAYVKVLQEDALVAILKESEDTLVKEAKIAKRSLEIGASSESDELQLEIAAERFASDRVIEEANARNARVSLELLLAVKKPAGTIRLADKLGDLGDKLALHRAEAKGERPDVVAAEAMVAQMEANFRLARAGRIPDLTLAPLVEHNPSPPSSTNTVGFGISLPLPIWNQNKGAIALAKAQKEAAELALQKVREMVMSDAVQASATYRATRDKWVNYRDTVVRQSNASLQAVRFAYEKGAKPLVALLDAIRSDNDVRTAQAQAASDNVAATADLQATQPYLKP